MYGIFVIVKKNKCLYLDVVGNNEKNAGIYCYKNQVFTQIFDENISVFGLALDSNDYLFATTLTGEIFYFNNNLEYTKLNIQSHHMLKNITFGNDGLTVYVSSFGGGMQKIVLKKVY